MSDLSATELKTMERYMRRKAREYDRLRHFAAAQCCRDIAEEMAAQLRVVERFAKKREEA